MTIQYADNRTRSGVVPPTRAELAEAEQRGVLCTGDFLKELRSAARIKSKLPVPTVRTAPVAAAAPTSSVDSLAVKKLKRQVETLRNENTLLKVKLMSVG